MSSSVLYMSMSLDGYSAYTAQRALEAGVLDELQIH